MKIKRVNFHSDVRVPKMLPGYGGSTSGMGTDDKRTITWNLGDNALRVDVKDEPDPVFIPLVHVSSMQADAATISPVAAKK